MNRLVQGDVGSGKTLVALLSMLIALDNGFQCALMAPTEILAQQHFATLSRMLGNMPLEVRLLTGSTKTAERKSLLTALRLGHIHILIGTHALLEDPVVFEKLGLVVIDEQHRFGVAQGARLW
jgi:ATP-dependent DNA helicase RecG